MKADRATDVWPQLSQKVIVDFINGTQVAGELVRVRSERKGLLARAQAALSGRGAAENHLIQAALVEGQMTTISWLEALQAAQADSDLALAKVARAVRAHRDHTELRDVEVNERFDRIEGAVQLLLQQQTQVRIELNARNELRWAVNDAEDLKDVSAFARAFYVVDRLWWGPFGAYVRMPPPGQEENVQRYVREARQEVSKLLSQSTGVSRSSLVDLSGLLREFQESQGPDSEMVRYLAGGGDMAMSPLHLLLTSNSSAGLPPALPRQSSVERIATRLWSETKWTAERRIDDQNL